MVFTNYTKRCIITAMDLKTYFSKMTSAERESLAARCGTTLGHLRNVAYGKTCGETLAIDIDRETGGVVSCEEMRPDLSDRWAYLRAKGEGAAILMAAKAAA